MWPVMIFLLAPGFGSFGAVVAVPTVTVAAISPETRVPDAAPDSQIVLAADGMSRYRIVTPAAPTENEEQAARVLQEYLLQIAGTVLPIVRADRAESPYEILLGQNERLGEIGVQLDSGALTKGGYVIRTSDSRLIIAGGSDAGTLYGVYGFLETHLGARMYSPSVKVIPRMDRLALGPIDDREVPAFAYRTTHYRVTWDAEYVDWHKLSQDAEGARPEWGLWVHTFSRLVPPELHYEDHPEYYAMVDGRRIPTQLCLTNPDVLDVVVRNLRREMGQNPDATYWSVSQNDNRAHCTCDRCRSIDEREGSPAGSILNFVNQVAERFPDKVISTLAYEYSRRAPRTLRPRENVNIMLCSIEVTRDRPVAPEYAERAFGPAEEQDRLNDAFREDVRAWSRIADDIIVWDYVIQFHNLISPFPNLHVLQPNIRFFADHGVTALFEQGNREVGGEFAELRAYLLSKLMWNPSVDVDSLIDDFLHGYYGAAARPLLQYIDEMHDALVASNEPLRIFAGPWHASTSYLTPSLIDRYEALFDQAEAAVADDPAVLERVRVARLPLEFAIMEQAKKTFSGDGGLFQKVGGRWETRPDIRARIDPFVDLANRQGVTRVKEWSTPPEEYRSAMYRLFAQGMNEHLAYGKPIKFITPDTTRLAPGAGTMLTDGVRGSHDFAYNWLGFSGEDLEVTIDLEEVRTVRQIESAYYQHSPWSMILPERVAYAVSEDGERFEEVAEVGHDLPLDTQGAQMRDFIADFAPRPVRYVRIKAYTIGNTPEWHPGAGRPARMLVDEIVVK